MGAIGPRPSRILENQIHAHNKIIFDKYYKHPGRKGAEEKEREAMINDPGKSPILRWGRGDPPGSRRRHDKKYQ